MGDYIRRGRIGEPKVTSLRPYQWTEQARGRFLDHLAATCNVRAACLAAGRHHTGAYALRRRDPHFAEQWRVAMEVGYDVLEAALLEHAIAPLHADETTADADMPAPKFDPERAFDLLRHYRGLQRSGKPGRVGGPVPRRSTRAETDAEILAALKRLDTRNRVRAAAKTGGTTGE